MLKILTSTSQPHFFFSILKEERFRSFAEGCTICGGYYPTPPPPIFFNPKAERLRHSPLLKLQVTMREIQVERRTQVRSHCSSGTARRISGRCDNSQVLHLSEHPNVTLKSEIWIFTFPPRLSVSNSEDQKVKPRLED